MFFSDTIPLSLIKLSAVKMAAQTTAQLLTSFGR